MLKRSTAISAVLVWTALGIVSPATAEAPAPAAETVMDTAPEAAIAIEHIDVLVEGQTVAVRAKHHGTDDIIIDAKPIFEALGSRYEHRESILAYWRFQDGAVMSLDFRDGKVRANGVVLGKLPGWEDAEEATADTWLSPNAIAVMTGTTPDLTDDKGWTFTLDDRLKPQFDLDLWVNDAPVSVDIGLEPRTVGPVLLIPLEPVAVALGHTITRDRTAGTVTITRVQDSAVLSLEIATGLVTVNGAVTGVSPNMSYAEEASLLLPFSAVETLTGSHIKLKPGSNRVEIALDDRLNGASLPGEKVVDEAAETPFTPERLTFQMSDRGPVSADFYSRFGGYNTKLRVETAGGIGDSGGLAPSWVSMDIQALDGWRANVGDYNAGFREFNGISASRVRGGAFRKKRENGTILAIAAGVPLTGADAVSERVSQPTFGGFAGGARIITADGRTDYGVAASVSEDGSSKRIVAGGKKDFEFANNQETGIEGAFVSADIGVFDDQAGTNLDVRARGEMRYRVTENTSIQGTASYDGAGFLRGEIDTRPQVDFGAVFADDVGARTVGTLSLDWRAEENWGFLKNVAGGVRSGVTHVGGEKGGTSVSATAVASARLGEIGPDMSVDVSSSTSDMNGETSSTNAYAIRGYKAFKRGNLNAAYSYVDSDGTVTERLTATGNIHSIQRELGDGATVAVGPSASFAWTPQSTEARLGAAISAQSGAKFGDKLKVRGQISALTSYQSENSGANIFASAGATYRISDNLLLQANYSDDLGGRRDFSMALRGGFTFNEPRKHTRPNEGTGVLKGRVFFDRNRDGVRQENEPGLPGVGLSVRNTRLRLSVGTDGAFTIQNIKTGLYDLQVDTRSLPLGMLVSEAAQPRVTIGEGRITRIDIPVIASGQVRGAVFVDDNQNGKADKGEKRLEGQWVKLIADDGLTEPVSLQSASFGQYGFENLGPGDYTVQVNIGGRKVKVPVQLTEEDLFGVAPVAVPPEVIARKDTDSGGGGGVLGTP